jgi:Bacterial cell division membrane protein
MDLPFLVLVLTLVAFGLVMLCSASSAVALYRRQDAFAYVRPQLLYAAMGLGAMWMASRVDYHIYHKLAWPLLALSLVLLTAVLFMPEYNGCKRWLVLPGAGYITAQRDRQICGGTGGCSHHRFETRPHGQLCSKG